VTDPLSTSALTSSSLAQDLFEIVVVLALVVTVALLAISYVIRMAVLQVLIATLRWRPWPPSSRRRGGTAGPGPALRRRALHAGRPVMVLRVATVTGLAAGNGLAATLYALAALWVSLKGARFPGLRGPGSRGHRRDRKRPGRSGTRIPLPLPARGI